LRKEKILTMELAEIEAEITDLLQFAIAAVVPAFRSNCSQCLRGGKLPVWRYPTFWMDDWIWAVMWSQILI